MTATKLKVRDAASDRPSTRYDEDLSIWALEQAALIRSGRPSEIDAENVAEEIESLGREQFSKIRSHLVVILLHMLNWDHQPERRTRSWTLSIRDSRIAIEYVLDDSPSLNRRRREALARAYRSARLKAALETDRSPSSFPDECPYSLEDVLSRPILWHDD